VKISFGGQVWVGLRGLAIRCYYWFPWGGLVEIYLHGVAEF
jgi:hypothetical protein